MILLINRKTNTMLMTDSKKICNASMFIGNLTKKHWIKFADFHL